ncbi:MAG: DUF1080 domain-containing protein [Candidatus Hinthialibacter antarcticus]|nr:DUF1080 domain-containing protein [Candidatus Hinthialibacter antarcticus]
MHRIRTMYFFIALLLVSSSAFAQFPADDGYIRIFNGQNLDDGWQMQWPGKWTVEKGILTGRQDPAVGGDSWLFTEYSEIDDFSLELEFKITKGGNSGVGIRMPKGVDGRPSQHGFEIQINDSDDEFPTGSVFRYVAASPKKHQIGKWNKMAIICVKDHIVVYLNTTKVLDTHLEGSKKGRIGFQVHGGEPLKDQVAEFRNIRIKDLKPQYKAEPSPVQFEAHQLDDHNGEGVTVFDVDSDGDLDITSGSNWYEAPIWSKHHYRDVNADAEFMQDFGEAVCDVNRDGKLDVVSGGWFEPFLYWFQNPGGDQAKSKWQRHTISDQLPGTETIIPCDLDRDGRMDLLVNSYLPGQGVSYFANIGKDAKGLGYERRYIGFPGGGHGMAFGDVNRDGFDDILTTSGWYQAPMKSTEQPWKFQRSYRVTERLSAPFVVDDLNKDGLADIIYGQAHDFGLFWMEQTRDSAGREAWIYHTIDPTYSQLHIILLEDIDGDGEKDIVAGKRYRGHGGTDNGANEPLCVFWYKVKRGADPQFTKHIISYDENIGTGMDMEFADIDDDGDRDLVVAGKSGQYLFENKTK